MADDIASDLTDELVADMFDVDPALALEVYNVVVVGDMEGGGMLLLYFSSTILSLALAMIHN
eukprot:9651820-Ditylum_brightwellii.AAC.1